MVARRRALGEGWSGRLGLVDVSFYIEKINNKVLLYSTGNYIQHPMINHNGKELKKKNVYMCITESLCCIAVINTTL